VRICRSCWLGLALLLSPSGVVAAQAQVDLALVLTIDCSYSIDEQEFALQTRGLAQAFLDPAVVVAIRAGRRQAIAVSIVQWSSARSQVLVLPWTLVTDAASAAAVAETLLAAPRLTQDGGTSISAMIDVGVALLRESPVQAPRRVVDISGDGRNNNGRDVRQARDAAAAAGVTVNGLAILTEVPTLKYYFEQYVIGGSDAFALSADSYADYADAIRRKLLREIGGSKLSEAGLAAGRDGRL
jgi:hypothetical protein